MPNKKSTIIKPSDTEMMSIVQKLLPPDGEKIKEKSNFLLNRSRKYAKIFDKIFENSSP